jgi:ABC-type uncharacterized transport system permease subunit
MSYEARGREADVPGNAGLFLRSGAMFITVTTAHIALILLISALGWIVVGALLYGHRAPCWPGQRRNALKQLTYAWCWSG